MPSGRYSNALPQLNGHRMLTDGGLETTLIFHLGLDLPHFASYDLMRSIKGRRILEDYYRRYAGIALKAGSGFILESPTWRAHADYGDQMGYSASALDAVNRESIEMLTTLRDEYDSEKTPFVISGNLGPRGDGYRADVKMTADEAEAYHAVQIASLVAAGVDFISIFTVNYVEEAIGVARAAMAQGTPVVISFTVETDGRLPSGQSLGEAIEQVDRETEQAPAYFMINCAHPSHFRDVVATDAAWLKRIRGVRANASRMSHEELDNAEELDAGNPEELGRENRALMALMPNLSVFGGCCGTDHRHVQAMADTCIPLHLDHGRHSHVAQS